ncbi:chorismate mutase [Proteiniborus ethanoligenes]|uniref:Chorismate mutase n=1 Tax=Proteiniborus ethanoligenes TaxID=415015 RepID=A0A1H3PYQ7_9FIRM|nr:chorismate mutase [Proteiniborus ethanoligenes]SDZ06432.1 chorismate mutase [Proteiniborus ethanoligenes]
MDELIRFRDEINKIDNELTLLFEKRMNISKRVAEYKKNNNIPIYDPVREDEIIRENIEKLNDNGLSQELELFYRNIFKISRIVQEKEMKREK